MNITYIEFFAFAVSLISSTKYNFEINQDDDTYTCSHQFVFITQYSF